MKKNRNYILHNGIAIECEQTRSQFAYSKILVCFFVAKTHTHTQTVNTSNGKKKGEQYNIHKCTQTYAYNTILLSIILYVHKISEGDFFLSSVNTSWNVCHATFKHIASVQKSLTLSLSRSLALNVAIRFPPLETFVLLFLFLLSYTIVI